MRKFSISVLIMLLAILLVACGGGEPEDTRPNSFETDFSTLPEEATGFYTPEDAGIWTSGEAVVPVTLQKDDYTLTLNVDLVILQSVLDSIEVLVGGEAIDLSQDAQVTSATVTGTIPQDRISDEGTTTITIRSNAVNPEGEDTRELGLLLSSLRITPASE